MPSGLEYCTKPGYEERTFYQAFIDYNRGGGLIEDSDLALQIILGNMEEASNSRHHSVKNQLNKLYELREICEEKSNSEDRSYFLEEKLTTPQDIQNALERHQI